MPEIPAFKSAAFWLKFAEFWLALLSFILTVSFADATINMFDKNVIYSNGTITIELYEANQAGINRINIIAVATCGYTWIILPIILITYAFDAEFLDKSILCPLYSFFGFLMFISAGGLVCARSPGASHAQAAGAFSIITALVFLGDIIFIAYRRFTQLQAPPQA